MELEPIQQKIFEVRGCRVMLDFHLAELYGVETKRLKEAVRRNIKRFPPDFMFEMTQLECNDLIITLRSQFATLDVSWFRYRPFAFTEHGITMLSAILMNAPKPALPERKPIGFMQGTGIRKE